MGSRADIAWGKGEFSFEAVESWSRLPPGIELGDVAGIAIDARDRVYLFNRGPDPVVVVSREGEFLNSWGRGLFVNPHGASIGPDDSLYLTDNGAHTVRKFTTGGKLLLTVGEAGKPSAFMSGKPFCRCTHTALSPEGDIYVSDGYWNACVHKYTPDGRHLFSWGSPGTGPGEFNLPHNIACDADGLVYVADRENHRVQVFDADGRYVRQINNMHRPSALAIVGTRCPCFLLGELAPYLPVNRETPNIGARLTIMGNDGALLGRIGSRRAGLEPGQFVSPHTIAVDSHGDLYVGEVIANDWNAVFPEVLQPSPLRRMQKFARVAAPTRQEEVVAGA
ncbi:MAG: hypothetical protein F2840_18485 [Actinobacteria bacterium]|uniref:Unannotated protein n=1 Tax=freshwater metagenome TaxID=449393 RepID=A0A6J7ME42_9ZZZZ|nr:hypothetical protein [Actinomycetota bacterium]